MHAWRANMTPDLQPSNHTPAASKQKTRRGPDPEIQQQHLVDLAAAAVLSMPYRAGEIAEMFKGCDLVDEQILKVLSLISCPAITETGKDGIPLPRPGIEKMAKVLKKADERQFPLAASLRTAVEDAEAALMAGINPFHRKPAGILYMLSEMRRQKQERNENSSAPRIDYPDADPAFNALVTEISLLSWQDSLGKGDDTFNPDMVARFLESREMDPGEISSRMYKMAETALKHDKEEVFSSPALSRYLSSEDLQQYRFRCALHNLVIGSKSRDEAARRLMNEGYDLKACDFNKWYAKEVQYNVDDEERRALAADDNWLTDFIAGAEKSEEAAAAEASKSEEEKGEVSEKLIPLSTIDGDLDLFAPEFSIDRSNPVQVTICESLYRGDFPGLAGDLLEYAPMHESWEGVMYLVHVLKEKDQTSKMSRGLREIAFAGAVFGAIVGGRISLACTLLDDPEYDDVKDPEKVGVLVRYAWEVCNTPAPGNEEPDRAFNYYFVYRLGDYLKECDGTQPYFDLLARHPGNSSADLSPEESAILEVTNDLELLAGLYTSLGRKSMIEERFLKMFDEVFDRATEFGIYPDISRIVSLIKDKTFRQHTSPEKRKERFGAALKRMLERKDPCKKDEFDKRLRKVALEMALFPDLRPLFPDDVAWTDLVDTMIRDTYDQDFVTKPVSETNEGEVTFDKSLDFHSYYIAHQFREHATPIEMQKLVAWIAGLGCDLHIGGGFAFPALLQAEEARDYGKPMPYYYREGTLAEMREQSIPIVERILEGEAVLGGLNPQLVMTSIGNMLYVASYAQPGRMFPTIDAMLALLSSRIGLLFDDSSPVSEAMMDYRILHSHMRAIGAADVIVPSSLQ